MKVLFWLCVAVNVFTLAVHSFYLARYLRTLRRGRTRGAPSNNRPKFFIAMPLRGGDESLERALRAVFAQDYADFELRPVIDHESDSAWEIVRRIAAEYGTDRLKASTLRVRDPNRSLYCSSLLQVLEDLGDTDGLLTFCAADMEPHSGWLREMAERMAEPKVGSTLGARWYVSPGKRWGTLLTFNWNAAALIPTWLWEIPWGGTSALRLEDVRKSRLSERWQRGMVEDAPIKGALDDLGLKFSTSTPLFVVDHAEASLGRACHFVFRQMLWTKLYHANWPVVVVSTVLVAAWIFAPFAYAPLAWALGDTAVAVWFLGLGLWQLVQSTILMWFLDGGIRRVLAAQGETSPPFAATVWLRLVAVVFVNQVVNLAAVVAACFTRTVSWRGVRYRVDGPWDVTMLDYRPYRETTAAVELPAETGSVGV